MTQTHHTLKQYLKAQDGKLSETHVIRLHRAISWLRCAEGQSEHPDLQFISLWIAFNACYGVDDEHNIILSERAVFRQFVDKLVRHDSGRDIYACLWFEYSGPVNALIKNQYVFSPFWEAQHQNLGEEHWKPRFEEAKRIALSYLAQQGVPQLMSIVLDRLYVLRNQLMHGGATYESMVNRVQVQDGCNMLKFLMPVIIRIMIDAKDEDWGEIYFPVISI